MSKIEIEAALAFLKKHYTSATHVTTFECYREKPGVKQQSLQKLKVEIHDYGEKVDHGRYMCVIRLEDGRSAPSNLMQTVESAIATVKMGDLN